AARRASSSPRRGNEPICKNPCRPWLTFGNVAGGQPIAKASNGVEIPRLLGVLLDLEAEAPDVDGQDLLGEVLLLAPDRLDDRFPRGAPAVARGEELEDLELPRAQAEGPAAQHGVAQVAIDDQVADANGRLAPLILALHAPELRADARGNLLHPERLRDVVVRAGLQSLHDVVQVALHRQDDDRTLRALPNRRAHLQAVAVGKDDVEEVEV